VNCVAEKKCQSTRLAGTLAPPAVEKLRIAGVRPPWGVLIINEFVCISLRIEEPVAGGASVPASHLRNEVAPLFPFPISRSKPNQKLSL
jgi:hypothetical protein